MNPADQLTKSSEALALVAEALAPLDEGARLQVLQFAAETMFGGNGNGRVPIYGSLTLSSRDAEVKDVLDGKTPPWEEPTPAPTKRRPYKKKRRAKKANGKVPDVDESKVDKAITRLVAKSYTGAAANEAVKRSVRELGKEADVYVLVRHAEGWLGGNGKAKQGNGNGAAFHKSNSPPIDSRKVQDTLDYIERKGPVSVRDIAAWDGCSYSNVGLRMRTLKIHNKVKLSPGTSDQYVAT